MLLSGFLRQCAAQNIADRFGTVVVATALTQAVERFLINRHQV
ncbi:hypothetical protein [Citrobacter freundii]|uniref:Uncharacterized protein n=1 Tax=Citrobacter freundii TaxID=546 RepID=A0A7G2IGK0_CITFR|nr:hypothetical protein [Citrobacter freundii]